jgi:protein-tyrosine phosphatase
MLREYAERFGAVLHVIADPANHPLVFHCAAGKDRTGLVAALVLSLCDVPDDVIVSDFAFTESRMPEIIARHTARAEQASSDAEVAAQQYGAQAATMHVVLQTLRDEHGSVAGYVRAAGITDDEIDALRAALVDG